LIDKTPEVIQKVQNEHRDTSLWGIAHLIGDIFLGRCIDWAVGHFADQFSYQFILVSMKETAEALSTTKGKLLFPNVT
jgi:hypothetical protein